MQRKTLSIAPLGSAGVGKRSFFLDGTSADIYVLEKIETVINVEGKDFTIVGAIESEMDLLHECIGPSCPYNHDRYSKINGCKGVLLIYSITSRLSFDAIAAERNVVLSRRNTKTFPMVLVGNKSDLESEREVSYAEGKELADAFGISFYETSAKSKINVQEVFKDIVLQTEIFDYSKGCPTATTTGNRRIETEVNVRNETEGNSCCIS